MSGLSQSFFNRDPQSVAKDLLGKLICFNCNGIWLSARIIETEAYYLQDKGSHASLGYTEKRKALFMPAGTIYMYYARGGDSLNVSCRGQGNAVLLKSGLAYGGQQVIAAMQQNNPNKYHSEPRDPNRLCSGQTLLCRSLGIKVAEWDQQQFDKKRFYIAG